MRFAIALLTLLIAGVLVAAGVAQRTVFKPVDHVTVAASVPADVHYVVVPGAVLNSHEGRQAMRIAGSGTVFAAYGRTSDVTAWLSGERYAELRVGADGAARRPVVKTAPAVAGLTGSGTPDPDGSDLWLEQQRTQRSLAWPIDVPSTMSVLIASDGARPAPASVQVSWPVRTATPLAVPLIVVGGALAVVGLLLYIWALVHVRRRRGPRRKPPARMPKRPQPPKYRPQKPVTVPPPPGRGRRSVRNRVAVRVSAVTALLLAGGLATPAVGASAASAPSTAAVSEDQAVTIVHRVAQVAAKADKELDATTAAERFGGVALQLRTAAYTIKKKDKKADLPLPVPDAHAQVGLIVPQATTVWPRTLFVVVKDPSKEKVAPLALAMVQNDPRSDYVVQYAMGLQAGFKLPDMPSALTGSARLKPGATVLQVQPEELATQYGLLLRDAKGESAATFDSSKDELLAQVGEAAKKKIAKKLGSTAGLTFSDLASDPASVIALSTADSGALVAVQLDEQWTAKPKRGGVTISSSGDTKILSKKGSSSKGFVSVYAYQLLFSVPSAGSDKPVRLLGYAQGLVSAKEL